MTYAYYLNNGEFRGKNFFVFGRSAFKTFEVFMTRQGSLKQIPTKDIFARM